MPQINPLVLRKRPFNILPDTPEIREAVAFVFSLPKEVGDNETRGLLARYWAVLRAEIDRENERQRSCQQ
jgi:hypothetical protein